MDISIKKYFPNLTQAIWMGSFVIIIPTLIGINQYGYFAKLYAIPSILAGLIDSYYLSSSSKNELFDYESLKNPLIKLINYLNLFFIILLFSVLIGIKLSLWTNLLASLAIFNSLLIRWRITFLFHRIRKKTILKDSTIFETINITFYLFSFLLFFLLIQNQLLDNDYLFLIPCLIISLSGTIIFYYSQSKVKNLIPNKLGSLQENKKDKKALDQILKIIFFRSYEDIFISIMPLIFFEVFGSTVAGQSRIVISIIKGISKVFPHRYDLFIYRELISSKYILEFYRDAKNFIINFALFFLIVFCIFKFINIELFQIIYKEFIFTNWSLIILSAPFYAVLSSITPYLNKTNLKFNIVWLVPLIFTYLIGFWFNSLSLLSFLFLLSNLFIFYYLKINLGKFLST